MVFDDHDITNLEAINQGAGSICHNKCLYTQEFKNSYRKCGLARGQTDWH